MRIAILFNSRSGAGRAARLSALFVPALRGAGHHVTLLPTHGPAGEPLPSIADLATREGPVDILAVIGGDGTVHRAAPLAARAGAALYHIPAGTENLFARHFGMTRDPATLVKALARAHTLPMDLGRCDGAPFVLMGSVGPDAGVIHRLQAARTGPIRQWSYLGPILAEILHPRLPKLSVSVAGEPWLHAARGLLVVANSPHYAWRLNPARNALADDGQLDATFFPCDTIADTILWAAALLGPGHAVPNGALTRRGAEIIVRTHDTDAMVQLDGEAVGPAQGRPSQDRIVFGIERHAFRVLDPTPAR